MNDICNLQIFIAVFFLFFVFFLGNTYLALSFFFLFLFRATPVAYGGSQPRGQIGAAAAGLCHRHSSAGSEPHLRSLLQLVATPDPQPTEQGQGSNLQLHGY